MERFHFTETDLQQMKALDISEAQVKAQIALFRKSSTFMRLQRPCILGDGVRRIESAERESYLDLHEQAAKKGRFLKFVPASGAATRMFQSLLQIYHLPQFLEPQELHRNAKLGVAVACDFLKFMEEIYQFAFVEDLKESLAGDGLDLGVLIESHRYRTILEYLLTDIGLNYGGLPKGLLKFHHHPEGSRTAFEEHLEEAVHYLTCANGRCRLHFTVSPQHEEGFRRLLEQIRPHYEKRYGVVYQISFSHQQPSTDTIAADTRNRPFRDRFGRLVFRPGGHGALLANVNNLQGDLVYIKNVDNVVQERFSETIGSWKRVLGGCLVALEAAVHEHLRQLNDRVSPSCVEQAESFAVEELHVRFPETYSTWSLQKRHAYMREKLDRPIRVCGVVQNVGEPGGAPFWVEDRSGELSLQIVEKAQVDFTSPEQQEIWNSSTHFNPVDLVCSMRNCEGKPFALDRYVDHNAVFISKKSVEGRSLKALELPGLWNGAMAGWLTVIVEVPRITFNPVKTIFDLLKPEHQPPPD
jgi:hypothetical protein